MGCWEIVKRRSDEKVMHTKLVLKMKRDKTKNDCDHKARLVVSGSEEVNFQEEPFSPLAYYFVIKLIFSLCIQRGWMGPHIDF